METIPTFRAILLFMLLLLQFVLVIGGGEEARKTRSLSSFVKEATLVPHFVWCFQMCLLPSF